MIYVGGHVYLFTSVSWWPHCKVWPLTQWTNFS